MSAVLTAQEPSAKYLVNLQPPLVRHFDLIAQAPGGVARLRELILTLAVQGKLVPQDPSDEPASELLKKIRAEKDRLIAEGKIKRDKPLAEITDEEKPFDLPTGWEWARIPEITHGLGQGEPTASFSYIDVAAIDNAKGRIALEVQVLEASDAPSRARKNVAQGTVIYSTVRPYLKNIAVVEYEYVPRAIASTAFAVMHPHTGVLSKYLLHYLRSEPFTEFVNSKAVGVAYPAINDANFFQGVIALPPAAEQSRIVTRVEELMQLCDALEASGQLEAQQHAQLLGTLLATLTQSETPEALADNWQRIATHFDVLLDRPEAVDALEQTILQLAVRGLLVPQDPTDEPASVLLQKIRTEKDHLIAQGKIKRDKLLPPITDEEKPFELPQGWEWAMVGHIAETNTGFAFKSSEYKSEGTLVFRVTNIRPDGSVDLSDSKFIDPISAESTYKGFKLQAGDVLLVMVGGSLGKIGVVDEKCLPAVLNQNMWKIVINKNVDRQFFVLCMRYINRYQLKVTSSTHGHLAQGEYLQKLVGLPPYVEQIRIVNRVNELSSLCADLRQRLAAGQAVQSHLADALVTG
ncbi:MULTISPECIES: restriction endonuclease subunit S [unclassified Limnohabitans]|uniref:restriction endonuclease subunit S n=1 Tax=unclassified Limnohabitans TaxID=2626134 RepID=UPI0011B1FCD0|nr:MULTISPECIES: restriction endonuclease subunit S [unclassified Limnohabitans]